MIAPHEPAARVTYPRFGYGLRFVAYTCANMAAACLVKTLYDMYWHVQCWDVVTSECVPYHDLARVMDKCLYRTTLGVLFYGVSRAVSFVAWLVS